MISNTIKLYPVKTYLTSIFQASSYKRTFYCVKDGETFLGGPCHLSDGTALALCSSSAHPFPSLDDRAQVFLDNGLKLEDCLEGKGV